MGGRNWIRVRDQGEMEEVKDHFFFWKPWADHRVLRIWEVIFSQRPDKDKFIKTEFMTVKQFKYMNHHA